MVDSARLRVTLQYLDPAPWRRVEVPLSLHLQGLHDTIQAAFLWFDCHLWEFDIGARRYGPPFDDPWGGSEVFNAANTRLKALLLGRKVTEMLYVYDMGDGWEHLIEVEGLFEAETGARLPRFIEGEGRTPPEDCGGPPGFELFLEALADPKHSDHAHFSEWYDEPFDVRDINEEVLRIQMKRLAMMRRAKA